MNSPYAPEVDRPDRLHWSDQAACVGEDVEVFYADDLTSIAAAKALCRVCPVRLACLTAAFQQREAYGVWGGLSAAERTGRTKAPRMTCRAGHDWTVPENFEVVRRNRRCLVCARERAAA